MRVFLQINEDGQSFDLLLETGGRYATFHIATYRELDRPFWLRDQTFIALVDRAMKQHILNLTTGEYKPHKWMYEVPSGFNYVDNTPYGVERVSSWKRIQKQTWTK